jgi:hypothetical protein
VAAANEAGRVPAFATDVLREAPLCIVDDVAAALNRANILIAVAAAGDCGARALHDVRRPVMLAAVQRIAAKLFEAAGRKRHGRLPDLIPLRMLGGRQKIKTSGCEQEQQYFRELSRHRLHQPSALPSKRLR